MTDEQKRIEQLEKKLAELKHQLQVYMAWCNLLMTELIQRNISVPQKPGVKGKVK